MDLISSILMGIITGVWLVFLLSGVAVMLIAGRTNNKNRGKRD